MNYLKNINFEMEETENFDDFLIWAEVMNYHLDLTIFLLQNVGEVYESYYRKNDNTYIKMFIIRDAKSNIAWSITAETLNGDMIQRGSKEHKQFRKYIESQWDRLIDKNLNR